MRKVHNDLNYIDLIVHCAGVGLEASKLSLTHQSKDMTQLNLYKNNILLLSPHVEESLCLHIKLNDQQGASVKEATMQ